MTVIVGFTFGGTATLVGDILASSNSPARRYIAIPTVDDPEQTLWEQLGYAPGLVQKLAFISPFLCVAWAGSQEGAARVVEEMEFVAGKGPVPKTSFLEYMDTIPNDSQTGSPSFIVLAVYDSGEVELLARNARSIKQLPDEMEAFCAGSGWPEAADLIRKRGALRESGPPGEIALGLAQKLAGTFHGRESAPHPDESRVNPLRKTAQYGAGFEVAILRNGRIEPEAETTLLFWTGRLLETGTLILSPPKLFIRRDFQRGKLVLRSMRIRKSWSLIATSPRSDQSCINVPRVDTAEARTPDVVSGVSRSDWPKFPTRYEVHVIRLSIDNGPTVHVTATRPPSDTSDRTLIFIEIPRRTVVLLNPLPTVALHRDLQQQFTSVDVRAMASQLEDRESG